MAKETISRILQRYNEKIENLVNYFNVVYPEIVGQAIHVSEVSLEWRVDIISAEELNKFFCNEVGIRFSIQTNKDPRTNSQYLLFTIEEFDYEIIKEEYEVLIKNSLDKFIEYQFQQQDPFKGLDLAKNHINIDLKKIRDFKPDNYNVLLKYGLSYKKFEKDRTFTLAFVKDLKKIYVSYISKIDRTKPINYDELINFFALCTATLYILINEFYNKDEILKIVIFDILAQFLQQEKLFKENSDYLSTFITNQLLQKIKTINENDEISKEIAKFWKGIKELIEILYLKKSDYNNGYFYFISNKERLLTQDDIVRFGLKLDNEYNVIFYLDKSSLKGEKFYRYSKENKKFNQIKEISSSHVEKLSGDNLNMSGPLQNIIFGSKKNNLYRFYILEDSIFGFSELIDLFLTDKQNITELDKYKAKISLPEINRFFFVNQNCQIENLRSLLLFQYMPFSYLNNLCHDFILSYRENKILYDELTKKIISCLSILSYLFFDLKNIYETTIETFILDIFANFLEQKNLYCENTKQLLQKIKHYLTPLYNNLEYPSFFIHQTTFEALWDNPGGMMTIFLMLDHQKTSLNKGYIHIMSKKESKSLLEKYPPNTINLISFDPAFCVFNFNCYTSKGFLNIEIDSANTSEFFNSETDELSDTMREFLGHKGCNNITNLFYRTTNSSKKRKAEQGNQEIYNIILKKFLDLVQNDVNDSVNKIDNPDSIIKTLLANKVKLSFSENDLQKFNFDFTKNIFHSTNARLLSIDIETYSIGSLIASSYGNDEWFKALLFIINQFKSNKDSLKLIAGYVSRVALEHSAEAMQRIFMIIFIYMADLTTISKEDCRDFLNILGRTSKNNYIQIWLRGLEVVNRLFVDFPKIKESKTEPNRIYRLFIYKENSASNSSTSDTNSNSMTNSYLGF